MVLILSVLVLALGAGVVIYSTLGMKALPGNAHRPVPALTPKRWAGFGLGVVLIWAAGIGFALRG